MKVTCAFCSGHGVIGEERLPPLHFKVLDVVRSAKNGITIEDLVDRTYEDCEDGGPLKANASVQHTIRQLNRRMRVSRMKIVALRDRAKPGHRPGKPRYRLIKVEIRNEQCSFLLSEGSASSQASRF